MLLIFDNLIMTYQTKGIILKKIDHKEADQFFSIYTEDKGKILALGRGTKKIQSKLNPSLHYFSVVDLTIANGKNFDHITGVCLAKNFRRIQDQIKKIILASFGLELVEKLTEVGVSDRRIFTLLSRYFSAINENDFNNKEWQLIKNAFLIKFLDLLGFNPPPEIVSNPSMVDIFLKNQLDFELKTERFLSKIFALT